MNTLQHIQFTHLFKAGGQLHEFNFRKSNGLEGPLFTVDVADEKGNRNYIIFRLEENQWKRKTKIIPAWIEEVLPQIQAIVDSQI